ncbi:MAG: transglutaminase-like domain-containing protein [Bacteroidales bacterium]
MKDLTNKDIKALLKLIDDPDENIYNIVHEKLIHQGSNIIPALEKSWEHTLDTKIQNRLEYLIQEIQQNSTKYNLEKWLTAEPNDLFKGAFLIAKHQYPELSYEYYDKLLEEIVKDIWIEINENLTALEKVRIINYVFFQIYKFTNNTTNFYAPQNNYINHVMDTKKGNPITLGILYSTLANRMDIPIYGVNLPKNFIVAYKNKFAQTEDLNNQVLFYINPFNQGTILSKKELDHFIKKQGLKPKKEYYTPCSNIQTLQRLINNLMHAYDKLGYPDKIEEFSKLYNILSK